MSLIKSFQYASLVTIVFFCFSNSAYSYYSEPYDEELEGIILIDPNQALSIAQKKLLDAELSGDVTKQLKSIYYIVSALSVLSGTKSLQTFIEKGLTLANKENNTRFKSEFTGFKAYQLEMKGNYNSAVIASNQALNYAYETNDNRLIAENLVLRGEMHLSIESYDLALKDIEEAIGIFKRNNDKKNISVAYNILAIIYGYLGEFDTAIKYYQESDLYDDIKSDYNQATLYFNQGAAYASKQDYQQAVDYYKKSKEFSLKTKDDYSIAFINYGMAEVFTLEDEIDQAELSLASVFDVFESHNDLLMLFNSNLLMAEIKTLKKDFTLAQTYLNKAEEKSNLLDVPSIYLSLIDKKILYFVAQNQWKEAYDLMLQFNKVRQKVQEKEMSKLISELKIRYNAQFDQEKLILLQKQNKLQKESILQERIKQNYLWGLIGLSVISLLILLLAYRNQKKVKKYLYGLSVTDYLTKVSNRRHIMQKLKEYQNRSIEQDFSFGVIMVDLDYFKKINDTYGHEVGNEVLIHFAKCAKDIMPDISEIGRIGGEEWLVLLPNFSLEMIQVKLIKLREAYRNAISLKIPKDCRLSFSSGVLINSGQYEKHEKMLFDVDMAMYKAKKKGREQDVYVSSSLLQQ